MRKWEEIECERCGKKIIKKNKQQKYCSKCSSQINRENVKKRYKQNHK